MSVWLSLSFHESLPLSAYTLEEVRIFIIVRETERPPTVLYFHLYFLSPCCLFHWLELFSRAAFLLKPSSLPPKNQRHVGSKGEGAPANVLSPLLFLHFSPFKKDWLLASFSSKKRNVLFHSEQAS